MHQSTLCSLLSIPLMLSVQCDPPLHASFPSIHAFIMLEGTMNLTGETQPLVEQLMMIKRMQVWTFRVMKFCQGHFSRSNWHWWDPVTKWKVSCIIHSYLQRSSQLFVFHSKFLLLFSSWRSGRLASPASLSHQRAQRSSNGLLSHSSRWKINFKDKDWTVHLLFIYVSVPSIPEDCFFYSRSHKFYCD